MKRLMVCCNGHGRGKKGGAVNVKAVLMLVTRGAWVEKVYGLSQWQEGGDAGQEA